MNNRAALQQPLWYFVLAGAVVFLVDAWLRQREVTIDVDASVRPEVVAEFEAQFGRTPTVQEREQAKQDWVTTELLFREAVRLGLENNDAVIRAHLANKLKQLVRERTIIAPPTDEELQEELEARPERYARSDTFNVSHAFVNRNIAPDTFDARVLEAWKQIGEGAELGSVGDHFPRGPSFEGMTQPQLEAVLRIGLAPVLKQQQIGRWHRLSGPRGAHFVRLDAIISGKPEVASARAALAARIEARKRDDALQRFIADLERRYRVVDAAE